MNPIRAFVGHSFTPDDDGVITAFLRYFDQVQKLHPSFSWAHAQVAEPTELARKVLGLVEGRNVFVGICTKKERVIASQKLNAGMFSSSRLQAKADDFEWKTSDWIIQEIGMAVGRGMPVILLLEEGCRKPGGLQGDVEFIPFERANPERAFGRLLEMITALAPPERPSETTSPSENAATSPEEEQETPPDTLNETPNASWDYMRFENAFVWKVFADDEQGAASIEEAYLKTPEAADPEKAAEWQAMANRWRLFIGKGGDLERLKKLRQEHPDNTKIIKTLAEAMNHLGEHRRSAEHFEAAAEKEVDRVESERLRGEAAIQLIKDGQTELALTKLDAQRQRISQYPDEELNLVLAIKRVAEISKNISMQLRAMERIVDLKPDDWDNRFNLAYLYSNNGYEDLSLLHYTQIPVRQRTAIAWNNLGVAYQSSGLPAKAVEAYRQAALAGETLAMSNLAYKFMEVGFTEEAREQLELALSKKDYHRNVGQAMTTLQDTPEKERKQLEKTLDELKPKSQFFKEAGRALVKPDVSLNSAMWVGPDCTLAIQTKDRKIVGVGSYERKQAGLGLAISGEGTVQKYEIIYDGHTEGHTGTGTIVRKRVGDISPSSLLSLVGSDDTVDFIMIINAAEDKISVMEKPTSAAPRFYELSRSKEVASGATAS